MADKRRLKYILFSLKDCIQIKTSTNSKNKECYEPMGGFPFEISMAFQAEFYEQFSSKVQSNRTIITSYTSPTVTDEDNIQLIVLISNEEIRKPLFSIDPTKSPSSDGLEAKFFQHYWDIVGLYICKAVNDCFTNDMFLRSVNHTLMTLIPKVANPQKPNQFRSISLCNTMYKIISIILVARLWPILTRIISPFLNAFTPRRLIHDNLHTIAFSISSNKPHLIYPLFPPMSFIF